MDLIKDGWFHERGSLWPGQAMSLQVEKVLHHTKSKYQDIVVFQSTNYGIVLVLDGVIQVTERDEFAYQEMITHIPLFAHANPKKVLVIGGGDGGVLREIAKHDCVEEIVICELDEQVIEVSKQYLPSLAKGFDDVRVTTHIRDGNEYMKENKDTFDVIITDSSDPIGPASVLFESSYYHAMYHSLRTGGIICTQGECMWLHLSLIQPLMKSISKLYTTVEYAYTTIPTYPSGQIGFIIATRQDNDNNNDNNNETDTSTTTDNKHIRTTCQIPIRKPNDDMIKELKYYTTELHSAAFVLPAFAKNAITTTK